MPKTTALDPAKVRAIADPLRAGIMRAMGDGQRTPGELAKALGMPLGQVDYGVKVLAEVGLLTLKERRPVEATATVANHYVTTPDYEGDLDRIAKRIVAGKEDDSR